MKLEFIFYGTCVGILVLCLGGCSGQDVARQQNVMQTQSQTRLQPAPLPEYWEHKGLESWIRETVKPVAIPELEHMKAKDTRGKLTTNSE